MTMEWKELLERYYILSPDWGSHTTDVLFRKDAKGFVHLNLRKGDDVPSISDLFVEPSARNKGIGQELLDAAEALARIKGFTSVFLWCTDGGWEESWYHRRGYRRFPNGEKTDWGDIFMEKDFNNNTIKK